MADYMSKDDKDYLFLWGCNLGYCQLCFNGRDSLTSQFSLHDYLLHITDMAIKLNTD